MNFLISDTNKNDALYLKQLLISVLNELNYEYKIDCINLKETFLNLLKYDFLFLDIESENKNGIEIGI